MGKKNTALDLTNSQKQAGTPVLSYPINEPKTKNQAWLLEHLPERSCEFPEADQKALRGDVVPECDTFRTQHLHAPDAKECYDRMNLFKFFGIESYVFTSHSEPGSPSGNGEWGYCAGYSVRSYKFFVGSSTGSGFGGDLDLPFS